MKITSAAFGTHSQFSFFLTSIALSIFGVIFESIPLLAHAETGLPTDLSEPAGKTVFNATVFNATVFNATVFNTTAINAVDASDAFEKLAPQDQEQIRERKIVLKYGKESPWPRSTAFFWIHAAPEEAAAIFSDYGRHREFFPNLTQSKVLVPYSTGTQTSSPVPASVEISYSVNIGSISMGPFLPPIHLGQENYTTRNTLTQIETRYGTGYQIQWHLVRADTTKTLEGSASFIPHPNGGTLFVYDSLIDPGSVFAAILVENAKQGFQDCIKALVSRVETWGPAHPDVVKAEIDALHQTTRLDSI